MAEELDARFSTAPEPLLERTFAFAVRIVKLCRALEDRGRSASTIGRQLIRSGTSVGANLEEARASQSEADFLSKASIACKEARETHYWLRLLIAADIVEDKKLQPLLTEADEIVAVLTATVRKLRARRSSGYSVKEDEEGL